MRSFPKSCDATTPEQHGLMRHLTAKIWFHEAVGTEKVTSGHRSLSECRSVILVTKLPSESDSFSSSDCIKSQSNLTVPDCLACFFFSVTKLAWVLPLFDLLFFDLSSLPLNLSLFLLSRQFFHLCLPLWSLHGFLSFPALFDLKLPFDFPPLDFLGLHSDFFFFAFSSCSRLYWTDFEI